MRKSKGGLNQILNQAQRLQGKLGKLEEEMKARTVEASSGNGKVQVVINGNRELIALTIAPEVISSESPGYLENLVISAVNLALENAREMANQEMSKVTGGFSIPGLL